MQKSPKHPVNRRFFILVVMAVILTTASVVAGAQQNTFTKWVTTAPAMAGVVGGTCGSGSYAGEILKYTEGPTTVIEALYHFKGSKHSFSALVHVEQTGLKAVINGVVTKGWLEKQPGARRVHTDIVETIPERHSLSGYARYNGSGRGCGQRIGSTPLVVLPR